MLVEVPRRWRWIIGALAAVSLIELAWLWFGLREEPTREADSATVSALGSAIGAEPPSHATDTAAVPDRAAGAEGDALLCNTWVRLQPDGTPDEADFDRASRRPQIRARLLATLRAEGSDYSRALAMLVEDNGVGRLDPSRAARRDALARIAASTRDPRVYALAYMNCVPAPQQPAGNDACLLLNEAQWARLDPGNAVPWTHALAHAVERKDAAGVQDALAHVASSQRSTARYLEPAGSVLSQLPSDEDSMLAALSLTYEMVGLEAAFAIPGYSELTRLCRGTELRDSNRRQVCESIADLLARRGDTLLDRAVGTSMGERLGWSTDVTDRLRGEYSAYTESRKPPASNLATVSCAAIAGEIDDIRRVARLGETGVMREWLAGAGLPADDLIRRGQAARTRRAAAEASAASAASAAR